MKNLCVICGKNEATSRDHIPPKGIFIKPRPDNLRTVPACSQCNGGASGYDEKFKVDLSIQVSNSRGIEHFNKLAAPTLEHNQKLSTEILNSMKPAYRATSSGIIYEQGFAFPWDKNAHDIVIERTIRGLYYLHKNKILGDSVKVEIHVIDEITSKIAGLFKSSPLAKIGNNNEINYRYSCERNNHLLSIWGIDFYESHMILGITIPNELAGKYSLLK